MNLKHAQFDISLLSWVLIYIIKYNILKNYKKQTFVESSKIEFDRNSDD